MINTKILQTFSELYEQALAADDSIPNAMTLGTVDRRNRPRNRIVLMKDFDANGFVFYTNYESDKGREIEYQPYVSLCFHWPHLQHGAGIQVRIEGLANKVSPEESDRYFATRPRESQLGAWASLQSQTLDNEQKLINRLDDIENHFKGSEVTRPTHWGGYQVVPDHIEFWYGQPFRLHQRVVWEKHPDQWTCSQLYP